MIDESKFESLKWLKNLTDFGANRKEKERKSREEERGETFRFLFSACKNFVKSNPYDVELSFEIPYFVIKSTSRLSYRDGELSFIIRLNISHNKHQYDAYIKWKNEEYNYSTIGKRNLDFSEFVINVLYEIYKKNIKSSTSSSNSNSGDYKSREDNNYGYTRTKKAPPKNETYPDKNRSRRLELLKQTLEGYIRTYNQTPNGPEKETLKNEIENIKRKIKVMESPRESYRHHVMSFKLFEKRFDPVADEYVMINYHLTNEPVPVKIIKRYPNNTYLVSFNVEGSVVKGAPEATIRNSDIISPYKPIRNPVGTGYVSANTNMQVRNTTNVNQVSNDMYL